MNTFIITYNRKEANASYPNYLFDTLDSIYLNSQLRPFVINDSKSHVWLRKEVDTHFARLTKNMGNPPINKPVARLTYANWLIHFNYEGDKLIFEDDVEVTSNFDEKLNRCIAVCQAMAKDNFILSVYSHNAKGKNVAQHPGGFYGTQCMYYPAKVSRMLAEWLKGRKEPIDLLIGHEFIREKNIKLFACTPSLVQHTGHVSTGCQGTAKQHYSKTFVK